MKIYFDSQKNIDFDKLSTYKIYTNYYKMLYTEDGIFKITDNNIYKIHIIDNPITKFSINGTNILIDKTIINYEKDIKSIPLNHKLFELKEEKYKLENNIFFIKLYSNNSVFDSYFETDVINSNVENTISNYL